MATEKDEVTSSRSRGDERSSQGLHLLNSFSDKKEPFVPHSSTVLWYSCGPTVYDSAHLGHSRNYLTIDILRRVIEDYFGYDVTFVMNITDVDDKIVLRARRNHLLQQYQKDMSEVLKLDPASASAEIKADALEAVSKRIQSQERAVKEIIDEHKLKKVEDLAVVAKEEEFKLQRLQLAQQRLVALPVPASMSQEDVTRYAEDVWGIAGDEIAIWQDDLRGATVTDPGIYKTHAEKYEAEFWEDMQRLGMKIPEQKNLTRVTEHMEDIIQYIQRIMDNGFAYASAPTSNASRNRSVYFDTQSYMDSGHNYPKLSPWTGGSTALAAAGEANFTSTEKKSSRDFALWKASKAGEPSWSSPWGNGRPGWHIECSAMASKLFGSKMDIHTGGSDLRFPHHDNELAQAEAHYHKECGCNSQWVNYFLHSGHLNINGLKMSKSLKNFYTIREILDSKFSATQLRLMFAMQPWHKEMNFVFSAKPALQKKENTFKHFFKSIGMLLPRDALRDDTAKAALESRFTEESRRELLDAPLELMDELDTGLHDAIGSAAADVHKCLLDNVNTGGALEALLVLVAATNRYLKQKEEGKSLGSRPHEELLKKAAIYVESILRVLGITMMGLGLAEDLTVSGGEVSAVLKQFRDRIATVPELQEVCSSVDLEDKLSSDGNPNELLDALTDFRSRVRACAKKHKLNSTLVECDRIRDFTMVDLGIRMEDRADGSSAWMADDPEALREERREREERAHKEALVKARKSVDVKKALLDKVEKQAKHPTVQEALRGEYSRFTSQGQDAYPTHDKDGKELVGPAEKKGRSKADSARKQRAFLEKQIEIKGENYLEDLRKDVNKAIQEFEHLARRFESHSSGQGVY